MKKEIQLPIKEVINIGIILVAVTVSHVTIKEAVGNQLKILNENRKRIECCEKEDKNLKDLLSITNAKLAELNGYLRGLKERIPDE